jgi:hypothetical protein
MGKDEMVSVTVIAGGCDDQSLFEQPCSVNALGIVGQDIFFRDIVNAGNRRSLTVAFSTENGNIHFVGLRPDVTGGKNRVFAVTFAAGGGIGGISL